MLVTLTPSWSEIGCSYEPGHSTRSMSFQLTQVQLPKRGFPYRGDWRMVVLYNDE